MELLVSSESNDDSALALAAGACRFRVCVSLFADRRSLFSIRSTEKAWADFRRIT